MIYMRRENVSMRQDGRSIDLLHTDHMSFQSPHTLLPLDDMRSDLY